MGRGGNTPLRALAPVREYPGMGIMRPLRASAVMVSGFAFDIGTEIAFVTHVCPDRSSHRLPLLFSS